MKAQHTPGPWFVTKFTDGIYGITFEDGGDLRVELIGTIGTNENQEANARLIAAAPELLEACQYIAYASEGIETIDLGNEEELQITITGQALKDLKEAIKKALGA